MGQRRPHDKQCMGEQMAVSKKKATPLAVPQSYAAADALLARMGELDRLIEAADTDLAGEVAKLKARLEADIGPLVAEEKLIAQQLEAFADARRDELTDGGRRKHHDMPAGRIGWRNDPPSVKFKKGFKEADIIERLKEMRLARFLRRTFTLNKQAMLDDPDKAKTVPGIRIVSEVEQFYIQPVTATLSDGAP